MERRWLTTDDGVRLEADVDVPASPTAAVVLGHPHPLYGGSMRTGMPDELFRRLPGEGVAALRFNFRGVEGSQGAHGGGVDEQLDMAAAVAALADEVPGVPLVVCAWSFGGDVSLCVDDPRITAWCPVAAPLAVVPLTSMRAAADPRPKHLLVPEHDQYSPPARTAEVTADWPSTTTAVLPGADHFLGGALRRVGDEVLSFVARAHGGPTQTG